MNERQKDSEDRRLQDLLKQHSIYTGLEDKKDGKFGPVTKDLDQKINDSLKGITSKKK